MGIKITLAILLISTQAWAAQAYYSPVTVNAGQVPSTQTDYPWRILQTDNRFKTIANGGHVANANGYDIRPYNDTGQSSAITYELAFYDGTTGTVEMYVKDATLDDGSVAYLFYGDAALTTDGSSTSTWSNSFAGVYHLANGTTLNLADSTGANNGTNHSVTATAGQIDGAGAFAAASSQYVDCGLGIHPAAVTISAWVYANSLANGINRNVVVSHDGTSLWRLWVKNDGKLHCDVIANLTVSYDGTGTNTLSTSTWYYLSMTYDSVSGLNGYVNASLDKNVAANGPLNSSSVPITAFGGNPSTAGYWDGKLDEVRIASTARSSDWLTTEYNEGFPATFETLGTEVPVTTSAGSSWFFFFP